MENLEVAHSEILKTMPVGAIVVEKKSGKIVFVNDRFIELLGFNPKGSSFKEYALNMARARKLEGGAYLFEQLPLTKALLYGEATVNQEIVLQKPDKTDRTIRVNAKPLSNDKGEVIGAIATFEDVTECNKVEEALKESEERFSKAFDTSPSAMGISRSADGLLSDVNEAFLQLFEFSRAEVIGHTSTELGSFAYPNQRIELANLLQQNGRIQNLEMPFLTKTGKPIRAIVSINKITLKNQDYLVSTLVDITERKKAEAALRESEERFSKAFTNSQAALAITRLEDGQYIDVNESFVRLSEFTKDELIGHTPKELRIYDPNERAKIVRTVREKGLVRDYELNAKTKTGKAKTVLFSMQPIMLNGQECAITTFIDMTERKKAEEALKESEQLYRTLFDNTEDGFQLFKPIYDEAGNPNDLRVLTVNKAYERQTGLKEFDVVGKTVKEVIPNIEPYWITVYGNIAKTGKSTHIENYNQSTNRWYDVYAFLYKKDQVGALFRDITERKKSEVALKEREERLMMAQQVARVGTFEWNIQTGVNKWTPQLEALYGLLPGQFGGTEEAWEQLIYPEDRAKMVRFVSEAMETGGFEGEWRVIWRDGSMHWLFGRAWVFKDDSGKPLRLIGINIDITERKKAEQALKESEARFRMVVENSRDGINLLDLKSGKYVFMSPAQVKLTGFTEEEINNISAQEAYERTHPEDRHITINQQKKIAVGEDVAEPVEYRWKVKSGEYRWFSDSRKLVRDENGQAIALVGISRDITERKKAEEALKETEEKFQHMIEQSPSTFGVYDKNGMLIQVNNAWDRLWQVPREYVVGKWNILQSKQVKEIGWLPLIKRAYTGETVHVDEKVFDPSLEPEALCKGRKRWVKSVIYPIKNVQGEVTNMVMMHEDVTEKKDLEKQLKESERLVAIGQTAGMVGHDIRNPLQAITGDIYLSKIELESVPDSEGKKNVIENLGEMGKNVEYIDKIVADLQDYAKVLSPAKQETNIEKVIEDLLVKKDFPNTFKISCNVARDAKIIIADPDLLKRIIDNLLMNAVQAMPKGGDLSVTVYKEADAVVLTVEDSGVGIPEEIKPKVFTPLFTTKSKGQGLGLAVVKRITEALGGTITFESQVGKGTTFIVRLPPPQRAKR